MGKELKRYLSKEDIQMVKPMKRRSTSLVIKEMQIKITIKYHFTPSGMPTIKQTKKKAENKKCWR